MMGAVRLHCLDGIWDCWCHVVIWVVIVAGVLCVAVDCVNAIDASASVWKVLWDILLLPSPTWARVSLFIWYSLVRSGHSACVADWPILPFDHIVIWVLYWMCRIPVSAVWFFVNQMLKIFLETAFEVFLDSIKVGFLWFLSSQVLHWLWCLELLGVLGLAGFLCFVSLHFSGSGGEGTVGHHK